MFWCMCFAGKGLTIVAAVMKGVYSEHADDASKAKLVRRLVLSKLHYKTNHSLLSELCCFLKDGQL